MTIQQKFERFHADNPSVYRELVSLVRQAVAKGYKRGSIKTYWEVLRWYSMINPTDENACFKFANHHHSRYARLIDATEPDLKGFFKLCALKSP